MRQSRLFRSSTFRLALAYMALFSASVLFLLVFIYWSTAGYMARQTDATIEAEIAGLADRYRLSGVVGLRSSINERLSRKPAGSSIYLLADRNYQPLVGNLDRWPEAPETPDGWLSFRLEYQTSGNGRVHMARARPFRLQGGFRLLVGRDIHELEETQKLIIKTLAWGLAFTIVVALIGGIAMSRSTMRRIEAINETSREIISGDLSRRIPTRNTGDDFDQLTDNLNTMLDQIESLMEDVRRVSDNIAHDLRTPLARLRSRLEIARMKQTDSESNKHMIEQAVQEADGLLSTFNSLLRIARIESKNHRANFINVAMNTLVEDVAELYEPLAEEKNQRLETTLSTEFHFHADRNLLFQAIANLLDNAIKYTARGGSIKMTLGQNTGHWRLSVADSGPGIPASARERVFQRFFRLEASRTTPGNGLGLSLVGAVANLHGIAIRLEDNHPGLRVLLTFPATQPVREGVP